jgi:protocatechuate 3,4-dioxygenase beta subunit
MRRFACATLLLVMTAWLGLAAAAQNRREPVGTIEGTVLSAEGQPVPDATVTIQTSEGIHPHVARTDSSGHFQFARYLTGQYDLRAYSNGAFSDWDKRVMIRSKKTTHIILRIVPTAK